MTKTVLFLALGAATLAATATPAAAEPASVRVQPYELETPAGRQAVVDRIDRVARSYCRGGISLRERLTVKECARDVGGQMIAQLGNPAVTAMWSGPQPKQVAAR